MRKILILAACAALPACSVFKTPPIPDNYVPDTGYYEINENGFNVWCYSEDDCRTPPKEAQLEALDMMCLLHDTDNRPQ